MQPRVGTSDNPVGGPPGIISANQGFMNGNTPVPDPSLVPQQILSNACSSCGSNLRAGAKFLLHVEQKSNLV